MFPNNPIILLAVNLLTDMAHADTLNSLHEDANGPAATVNELLFGYYINNGAFWGSGSESLYRKQAALLNAEELKIHRGRAKAMAAAALDWAGAGAVRSISWLGRDRSSLHPADIVVVFKSGRELGFSLKSTASGTDEVGFANPGMTRLEESLGVALVEFRDRIDAKLVRDYGMPEGYADRVLWLEKHPRLALEVAAAGLRVLDRIRDAVLAGFRKMKDPRVRRYILQDWLQSDPELVPPYVVVTGRGVDDFTASVRDPLTGPVVQAVKKSPLSFVALGQGSVAIYAGAVPVLCVRIKWAKGAFASSLEVIGEPLAVME